MAVQRLEPISSKLLSNNVPFHGKSANKVSPFKWLYRKANWLWKLIIVVALVFSGIYICISGIEKRALYNKIEKHALYNRMHKRELAFASNNEEWERRIRCAKPNLVEGVSVHYPEPQTFDRMDCSCTPVHNFVIFSMQRSGSGWFETLLNSHPNISSHGEVFSVDRRKKNLSTIRKHLDTIYNLDWISSAAKNDCTAAVGFKWMFNQGVLEYQREVATYFKDNFVSVIFLLRRNILRRYISILANSFDRGAKQLNGTHLSHVHSKEEAKVLAAYKPKVDVNLLVPYLNRVERMVDKACSSFKKIRHLKIYYEDLVANPREEMRRAQKFLGVEMRQLESKHVKIHTQPLHDQIVNWHDVHESLKGSKYEIFLKGEDYE